jgi:hypothetical protein
MPQTNETEAPALDDPRTPRYPPGPGAGNGSGSR